MEKEKYSFEDAVTITISAGSIQLDIEDSSLPQSDWTVNHVSEPPTVSISILFKKSYSLMSVIIQLKTRNIDRYQSDGTIQAFTMQATFSSELEVHTFKRTLTLNSEEPKYFTLTVPIEALLNGK